MNSIKDQLKSTIFLTDGGLETDLIFNKNIDLPHFAAFPLVENPKYKNVLTRYFEDYLEIAKNNKLGFVFESPTWRANQDWGYKLGFSKEDLVRLNVSAIEALKLLKHKYSDDIENMLISGQIGPRGDGYQIDKTMTPEEAAKYHRLQINAFKNSESDMITAITMTYSDEALGIVNEAKNQDMPVVISFTVETDGKLPSRETLEEAINKIDRLSGNYPLYYMINCAHPTHFLNQLKEASTWTLRIQGVRANASCKSHAELDESTEIDKGDKENLGKLHKTLIEQLPNLRVFGGCCGTDSSHIETISRHILN